MKNIVLFLFVVLFCSFDEPKNTYVVVELNIVDNANAWKVIEDAVLSHTKSCNLKGKSGVKFVFDKSHYFIMKGEDFYSINDEPDEGKKKEQNKPVTVFGKTAVLYIEDNGFSLFWDHRIKNISELNSAVIVPSEKITWLMLCQGILFLKKLNIDVITFPVSSDMKITINNKVISSSGITKTE